MDDFKDEPIEMDEPERFEPKENVWMRGLWMLVFLFLFALAETLLGVIALIQFLWMVFTKEKNRGLADFGEILANWVSDVALYQSGKSDQKPFPWTKDTA